MKANGFRHQSIDAGINLTHEIGLVNKLSVTTTEESNMFNIDILQNYRVVVFCNTSGNNLLNVIGQTVFENFIRQGGGFVGIYVTPDSYRNRSLSWYNV